MADDGSGSWPAWSEGSSESLAMTGRSLTGGEVEPPKAAERKMSGSSSDDSIIDQWRRSIVVSDVPVEKLSMLIMRLELKKRGGGKIDSYTRDADSRKVLVTFSDAAGERCLLMFSSIITDQIRSFICHSNNVTSIVTEAVKYNPLRLLLGCGDYLN